MIFRGRDVEIKPDEFNGNEEMFVRNIIETVLRTFEKTKITTWVNGVRITGIKDHENSD